MHRKIAFGSGPARLVARARWARTLVVGFVVGAILLGSVASVAAATTTCVR